jgi:hypothetical protein
VLRINTGGTFRPAKSVHYQPLRELVPHPGTQWVGQGTAFQGPRRRLNCTLLARWEEGDRDPWLGRGRKQLTATEIDMERQSPSKEKG